MGIITVIPKPHGPVTNRAPTRLLVIGLDGATFDIIDPLIGRGELPAIKALLERGVSCRLRSTIPPFTLPAWTTFMTGVNPGKHGIFGFTQQIEGTYKVVFVNSTFRLTPTFWQVLSGRGRKVCAMLFPGTYPPDPVNGIMISGFDAPVTVGIDRTFYHPRALYRELARTSGRLMIAEVQETRINRDWHERAAASFPRTIERKREAALHLLRKGSWDCFGVLFGEADTAAHHFWAYHDRASPRFDASGAARFGSVLEDVYKKLDEAVGALVDAAGPATPVMIASDHGFGGAGTGVLHLNRWLAGAGYLRFPVHRRGALAGFSRLIGPRLLPVRLQEAFFRTGSGRIANAIESRWRQAKADWQGSMAYSDEENYLPGIRINLKGREPEGIVPSDRYEELRKGLSTRLLDWKDPYTGRSVIKRVWNREDLYQGPGTGRAPDLILEPALDDGYSYAVGSSHGPGPAVTRIPPARHLGGKGSGMNGTHRRDGIMLLAAPSLPAGRVDGYGLVDMAATIYAILDEEPPAGLDGSPVKELFPDGEIPERYRGIMPVLPEPGQPQPQPYSPAAAHELQERLRRLGYLE